MKSRKRYPLSVSEQKALSAEIDRQLSEHMRELEISVTSIVLYTLREELRFGHDRLKRFHDTIKPKLRALSKRYEIGEEDISDVCEEKLRDEVGLDVRTLDSAFQMKWEEKNDL